MKLSNIFLCGLLLAGISSCKKASNNTTVYPKTMAAFTVDGLVDVTMGFDNNYAKPISMPITVTYHDSAQQPVTISVSGAPSFIFTGISTFGGNESTGPWTGVPTFTIPLVFYRTGSTYTAGQHTITVTATTATSSRSYTCKLSLY